MTSQILFKLVLITALALSMNACCNCDRRSENVKPFASVDDFRSKFIILRLPFTDTTGGFPALESDVQLQYRNIKSYDDSIKTVEAIFSFIEVCKSEKSELYPPLSFVWSGDPCGDCYDKFGWKTTLKLRAVALLDELVFKKHFFKFETYSYGEYIYALERKGNPEDFIIAGEPVDEVIELYRKETKKWEQGKSYKRDVLYKTKYSWKRCWPDTARGSVGVEYFEKD